MVTAADQGRKTRARLMAAAIELIATQGWGAVTTRMVAEQAGVRPGLVHYHFASVDDLLIDASLRLARAEVENALVGALRTSGLDAISTMITAIARCTGTDTPTVVMSEMLLAATRHQRLRAEASAVARRRAYGHDRVVARALRGE
ncbi:TetR/AcrR family transcriptional regulator [Nocardia gamkensis]|uniref:TetR/AcrR family transcriptional regulator n=1 Tax=Nocardia gamkensis TaxID=352869 RepID=UPI0037C8EB76